MKPETIKNHRMLWDGIIAFLETKTIDEIIKDEEIFTIAIWNIKELLFKKLFGNIYVLNCCWLCHENYSQCDTLSILTCKCPLQKYHSCKLYNKLQTSFNSDFKKGKITRKTIRIAKRIRNAV